MFEALAAIEPALHVPIARDALPGQLPGPTPIDGDLCFLRTKPDPEPELVPHVTIHVAGVPAGTVLAQLLEQTGLGFEQTTGYSIVPR